MFEPLAQYHKPLSAALGVLGVTGRTAYHGVFEVLQPQPGEVLFVTGAAGATGSVAGQLGKIAGCRVFGSAGTAEKVRHLVEDLGFDGAFNYNEEEPIDALRRLMPDGIDLFLENTGGAVSAAVLRHLRPGARVAVSGTIHWYHYTGRLGVWGSVIMPGSFGALMSALASPRTTPRAAKANLVLQQMRGWHSTIHTCRRDELRKQVDLGGVPVTIENYLVLCFDGQGGKERAESTMAGYVREGRLKLEETILRGTVEDAPRTAINVWTGGNTGKQLLELVD